jgi:hypothetical protein
MAPQARKKTKKAADVEPTEQEPQIDTEPVVMQLPLSKKRVDQLLKGEETKNTPLPDPVPYSPEAQQFTLFDTNESVAAATTASAHHHDLTCYWCCHKIHHTEYGMPIRFDAFHNNFTMYGSFCSLECAAAYNFSMHTGCDRVWEIHSWIQLLGQKYGFELPIRPSPSRYLLKMFNGPLTIEEFRSAHKSMARTYTVNIPPLIHVSNCVESVNTSYLEKNPQHAVVKKKIAAASTKPTIDQKMNLFVVEETT